MYASVDIFLGGTPMSDLDMGSLVSLVVENAITLPDSFTACFTDPDGTILKSVADKLGSPIKIDIVTRRDGPPKRATVMEGDLTSVEVDYETGGAGEGTQTILRGLDKTYRMQVGRKTRAWHQVSASDVAKDVAANAGLSLGTVTSTRTIFDHVVQSNVSDLEFLKKLASENDREAVISDGKFHFRKKPDTSNAPANGSLTDPGSRQIVLHGNSLRSLHATVRVTGQVKDVEVRGWDPKEKKVVVGTATAGTSSAQSATSPGKLASLAGGGSFRSVTTPISQASEADDAAKGLADRLASSFAEIDGRVDGDPELRAGVAVNLSNVGTPMDGKYVVTSAIHRVDHSGYETEFWITGQQDRSLLGLIAGGIQSDDARIPGVVPAIVTNNQDPEMQGRVKIKIPWLDDQYETDWCRMVFLGGGSKRGALFLPEVDDEVLVAFEQGDPRRPYVVGALFNGKDKPDYGSALFDSRGQVNRKGYMSRKGSQLVFFDDDADEGIALISSDKGLKLSLNKTKTTVHIASNGEIKIEGTSKVTIDGGSELELKASSKVTIGSDTAQVEVKGVNVKVSGSAQVAVSAPQIGLG